MSAPQTVLKLVDKFKTNRTYYMNKSYNEASTRRDFIEPFFKELGWNTDDSMQVAPETSLLVEENGEERAKHPDIAFIIGNDIRFYVEAKRPFESLTRSKHAYQVRRYGWTRNLPLSVLTDFEHFHIYNCRQKPHKTDKPHIARLNSYSFTDYIDKWDEIANLFHIDAVAAGAPERYVEMQNVFGTINVDQAFLGEMEDWRVRLARNIASFHPNLTPRQLNTVVQLTIDRIVFLRICEDRNIEPYGRLKRIATSRDNIYKQLTKLYIEANDKYNSGLFDFTDDGDPLSLDLHIDNEQLHHIIYGMYYPDSPYEFSVFPADILGQVYERFLGKVIEIKSNGVVEVVEKPEVRKAGGVYYTPTYIVNYIVENTIGKLLEGKTPNQVDKLRILDPACGSGSFLIGAYQYLIDWHTAYYVDKLSSTNLYNNRIRETKDLLHPYALTTEEKKRILLNNIYGVDLDSQAVEVTKLSLLLKMLEGETATTVPKQYQMFQSGDRILPDLSSNIRWGNSLISSDFYSDQQINLLTEEELYRVKSFDWEDEQEGFGRVMKNGGFDAVIGNPPYIRIQVMKETAAETIPYYSSQYVSASHGNYDIYVVFVERGLKLLNANGRLGYILPHKFFNTGYGKELRGLISQGRHLSKIVNFKHAQVFAGATTYTCLVFLDVSARQDFQYTEVDDLDRWRATRQAKTGIIATSDYNADSWNFVFGEANDLFEKLKAMPLKLEQATKRIFQGLKTGSDKVYIVDEIERDGNKVMVFSRQIEQAVWLEADLLHPLIKGGDSKRYEHRTTERRILFPYTADAHNNMALLSADILKADFPLTWNYFQQIEAFLRERERQKMDTEGWYGYTRNQALDVIASPKIFTPDISTVAAYSLDESGQLFFTGGAAGGYGILPAEDCSSKYLLGLLNSRLLDWFLHQISTTLRGGWYSYESRYIKHIPIRPIDFNNPNDKAQHSNLVASVNTMLDLYKQLSVADGAVRQQIQKNIAAKSREIDQLVYQLYDLSPRDIKIIEGH